MPYGEQVELALDRTVGSLQRMLEVRDGVVGADCWISALHHTPSLGLVGSLALAERQDLSGQGCGDELEPCEFSTISASQSGTAISVPHQG